MAEATFTKAIKESRVYLRPPLQNLSKNKDYIKPARLLTDPDLTTYHD